jgi:hypothetical protein
MARTKGSNNKVTVTLPDICKLPPDERVELLANLIIDQILEDQAAGQKLLKTIGGEHDARQLAAA